MLNKSKHNVISQKYVRRIEHILHFYIKENLRPAPEL